MAKTKEKIEVTETTPEVEITMAEPLVEVEVVKGTAPKTAREIRWAQHVEGYAAASPIKFAAKKARGEFDTVPATFK